MIIHEHRYFTSVFTAYSSSDLLMHAFLINKNRFWSISSLSFVTKEKLFIEISNIKKLVCTFRNMGIESIKIKAVRLKIFTKLHYKLQILIFSLIDSYLFFYCT